MFKTLLGWIFNAWVLAVLGWLAVALLIWFVGPLIGFGDKHPLESETSRWVLIGVLLGLYVARKMWLLWGKSRANGSLIGWMSTNAKQKAAGAAETTSDNPDHNVQQTNFLAALDKLKKTRFASQNGVWASATARQ
jgi:type VI secretion system protein ImpL